MTTTNNLGLTTYSSESGSLTTFLNYRLATSGTTTSNLITLDNWAGETSGSINALKPRVVFTALGTSVSTNYYVCTVGGLSSYTANLIINLRLYTSITGSTTININSLGDVILKKVDSGGNIVNLSSNDMIANQYYIFVFNGTNFVMVSGGGTSGSGSGTTYGGITPIIISGSEISHATTAAGAGNYLSANITIDNKGHITSASSGVSASSVGAPSDSPFITSASTPNLTNYRIITAGSNITITSASVSGGNIIINSSGTGGSIIALGNAIPQSINISGSTGTSGSASHEDHIHPHGNLSGSSLHTLATSASAGFMPFLSENGTQYLNGAGTWSVPTIMGNSDGIVKGADIYNNANISIPNDLTPSYIFNFNSMRYDTGNFYNAASSSKLTIPNDGWYAVAGSLFFAPNSTGIREIFFKMNDSLTTLAVEEQNAVTGGFNHRMAIAIVRYFQVGDYVVMGCYQNSGSALNVIYGDKQSPEFSIASISGIQFNDTEGNPIDVNIISASSGSSTYAARRDHRHYFSNSIAGSGIMSNTTGSIVKHNASSVSPGNYLAANITVDSTGHVTSASSGVSASSTGAPSDSPFVTSASTPNLTNYSILTAGSNITITSASISGGGIIINSSGGTGIPLDGWIPSNQTWTYISADAPTYTFSEPIDATTKYSPGMKLKCTKSGSTMYGIVTGVGSYTSGSTVITSYCGTDYTLGATITDPYYSLLKSPFGFPLNPIKWMIEVSDTSNRNIVNPVQNTWYSGSVIISIPIGSWNVYWKASGQSYKASAGTGDYLNTILTLSTANNSESDVDLTAYIPSTTFATAGAIVFGAPMNAQKILTLTTKTSYYLNMRYTVAANPGTMTTIYIRGDLSKTILRAICAYL